MRYDDDRRDEDEEFGWRDVWYGLRAGGMLASALAHEAVGSAWSAASRPDDVEDDESDDDLEEDVDEFDELAEGDVFHLRRGHAADEAWSDTPDDELDEGDIFYLMQEEIEHDE